jgi:tetratricopeptide (TPR) repeat protein
MTTPHRLARPMPPLRAVLLIACLGFLALVTSSRARPMAACSDLAEEHMHQGITHSRRGDYLLGIEAFTQAIEHDPRCVEAHGSRGLLHARLGHYERAIEDLSEALYLDPRSALLYCSRADVYYELQDYGWAIEDYSEAIRLDPHRSSAYLSRGLAYLQLGDHQQSLRDFRQATETDPQSVKIESMELLRQLPEPSERGLESC